MPRTISLKELREPFEVYEAAEGDLTALIAYLRSDGPINDWMRQELADWLEGNLPAKLPRGRQPKDRTDRLRLKLAWELYDALRNGKIPMPDELANMRPKSDDIKVYVAEIYGLRDEHFIDFMKRPLEYRRSVTALVEYNDQPKGRYLRWKRRRNK